MPRRKTQSPKKGLRPFLPWEAFRALYFSHASWPAPLQHDPVSPGCPLRLPQSLPRARRFACAALLHEPRQNALSERCTDPCAHQLGPCWLRRSAINAACSLVVVRPVEDHFGLAFIWIGGLGLEKKILNLRSSLRDALLAKLSITSAFSLQSTRSRRWFESGWGGFFSPALRRRVFGVSRRDYAFGVSRRN